MKNAPTLLKYLLWPGLMLVSASLVVGVLNGWTLIAVALIVVGLMLMVASITAGDFNIFSTQFWQRRSTQAGTNAVVSVFSVVLILGLVNFLGARYDSRTDLTEGQLLTLSPASQEVVQNLEQPAKVLIFSPSPNPTDQQLLENYRRFNRDLTYEYIDPFSQPQLAQELGVETGGEVFLQTTLPETVSETAPDTLSPSAVDAQTMSMRTLLVQRTSPQEPLSERALTNSLAQLSQTDIAVVYFLQGHGEYAIDGSRAGLAEAAIRLKGENFTVAPLNLADTGDVPEDANVVIIAGLQQKLFESEIITLRDYLEKGGSLFVLIDPQVESGLEILMSQWGVVPEKTIVIDTSGGGQLVGLGPAAPLVTDYGDHPITNAFNQGRSFFPVARPLQIREVSNVEESTLLFTNQNSHAQPIEESAEISVDETKVPEGPFALGVALSRPAVIEAEDVVSEEIIEPEAAETEAAEEETAETNELEALENEIEAAENEVGDRPAESRMVVIGNSSFATDGLFDQQLNGDVFLNSVSWLSQIDSPTLSIRPKEATNRRLNMTVQQQILLMLLALVVFPLLGLIGAGALWAQRR